MVEKKIMRIGADEHLLVNQRSKMWMSEAKMVSENMSEADLVTRELLKASKSADFEFCGQAKKKIAIITADQRLFCQLMRENAGERVENVKI